VTKRTNKEHTVFNQLLFWGVVATLGFGQALLLRSAWRLRTPAEAPPPGVPRSDPQGDLLWTLGTALATAVLLVLVYQALP
jgi:hypothetical protein